MQNIAWRERAAVYAIGFWLATDFGVAVAGALRIAGLGGTGPIWSTAALDGVDRYTGIAGGVYLGAFLLSAVCVARWMVRASVNAHTVSDAMTISPRWSIGFFFVPIANLWKPFQALRETWQASLAPGAPDSVPVPTVMRVWWGLWLLNNVLGNVSLRLVGNATTAREVIVGGWLEIFSFALDVPMALLLILLIRRLSANQRALVDVRVFE